MEQNSPFGKHHATAYDVLRTLSFFGWVFFDLLMWWLVSPSTLKASLEGKPFSSDPVARLLMIVVVCGLFAAVNSVVKPVETLWKALKAAEIQEHRTRAKLAFAASLFFKWVVSFLCLYLVLSNLHASP